MQIIAKNSTKVIYLEDAKIPTGLLIALATAIYVDQGKAGAVRFLREEYGWEISQCAQWVDEHCK
jgi:hypothetical protein